MRIIKDLYKEMKGDKMFKICVVGCGGMSFGGHGPSFKKYFEDYKDVCLAGCCDINEEAAKIYKEQFGFEKHYTDLNCIPITGPHCL